MSNKGLTFIIFILILLCVGTFGAFYLKINPQLAISQKIFGTNTVSDTKVANNTVNNNAPFTDSKPADTTPMPSTNPVDTTTTVPSATDGTTTTPTTTAGTTTTPDTTTPPATVQPTAPTGPITTIVKMGSKGAQAKIVQQFLIDNKYLTGKADGVFGSMSVTALKKFQAEYKINVDGVVDGKTRDMINELLAQ